MPRYRYKALDAQGTPVSGQLQADSRGEALGQLEARGLQVSADDVLEVPDDAGPGRRITADEATELAGQVAELAKAGLPLAAGLRALADEVRRGRLPAMLRRIAGRLDNGASLEDAFQAEGGRFPGHIRGLIVASARSGSLPEALEGLVTLRRQRADLRRRVWVALAYPLVLLSLLAVLYFFVSVVVVPQFFAVFDDFEAELPAMTQWLRWLAGPGAWMLLATAGVAAGCVLVLAVLPGPAWTRRMFYTVPVLGSIWRWRGLVELSRLMALLLEQHVPLPAALRLAGEATRRSEMTAACRAAADHVEGGGSLDECVARLWQFPATLRPLLKWGREAPALSEAFKAAAEIFEGRVRVYVALLESVFPPVVFTIILCSVSFLVIALFMPLISLIQHLT